MEKLFLIKGIYNLTFIIVKVFPRKCNSELEMKVASLCACIFTVPKKPLGQSS